MTSPSPHRAALAALLAYVGGALLLCVAVWGAPTTSWVGRCCDPEQSIWFLGWTPYALGHGLDPLFTTTIGAPAGVNLMWNAFVPALGIAGWLPAQLGGPIFAYNTLVVAGNALSGWTAFLALRRYAGRGLGPFVGGAVYAFSPYLASHAELHLNLLHVWVPPLFLLVLDELLVRRRQPAWRMGIALGLLSVVQLFISEEIFATSVIAAGILVAVIAVSHRPEMLAGLRRLAIALSTAAATFLVLAGVPLAVQFLGPQRLQARVQDSGLFSTDLLNLFLPTPYQLIAPAAATDISSRFSGLYHEATAYLGLPLLVLLVVVAIERWHDRPVRVATITGFILLVLSLGPHLTLGAEPTSIPLPWLPFTSLPILEHVLPGRLTLFVWLAVAGVVAMTVEEARSRGRAGLPRLFGVAVALAVILPTPLGRSSVDIPPFFTRWPAQAIPAGDTVLIAPLPGNGTEASAMLWAAAAGYGIKMADAYAFMPLADGRTSAGPPSTALTDAMRTIQRDGVSILAAGNLRAQLAADLRAGGIRHVIVGPMPARDAMVAFFTNLFGRPPEDVEGVAIWRDVGVADVK
ncbi:MAG: hypothetical protein HY264_07925 [Chloroflexi bacterium]|nr:hypothetical protein [Chloroflexota bacterium]